MSTEKLDWGQISAFSEPKLSPGFTLWHDFMRWQRELNARLRPLELTQPQFAVLAVCAWLSRESHEVTQQKVVDFLGMDRMHISQIASRLEQNGLIERKMAATDIRAKHVKLTEKGQKLLAQAMPIVEEFDRAFFS
jgi:MarR family transcriptional regulator, organic hydroperoxide resistance regulator